MFNHYLTPALLAGVMFATAPAGAQNAQNNTIRQGFLTCRTAPTVGLIVGSRQRMNCEFRSNTGWTQRYSGVMNRIGLDVGITAGGVMSWAVLASTSSIPRGALTGRFVGASGDVSLGVGLGANVLLGGTRKSVSLQPVSVEGQIGVNLALGVAGLTLRPVK